MAMGKAIGDVVILPVRYMVVAPHGKTLARWRGLGGAIRHSARSATGVVSSFEFAFGGLGRLKRNVEVQADEVRKA